MEFTLIGFICIVASVAVIARPLDLGLVVFGVFMPLQTAAAVNLWAIGGMSIICTHVLMGALTLAVVLRPGLAMAALKDLPRRPAVVIFALFVAYGVFSAFFYPRLFAGEVFVYSLERPPKGSYSIPLLTLHPTSGNITQSFYLVANLFLFTILAFIISRTNGVRKAKLMISAATVVHLVFAGLSVMPQSGPIAMILETVRTANYSILSEHTMVGMRRVIGSYAEASAFGSMSAGLFAFNFMRFMQTRGVWFGFVSILLLACIVFSFSTTAYAVLGLLIFIWCVNTSLRMIRVGLSGGHLTALFLMIVIASFVVSLFFLEPVRELAAEIYEKLFGAKLESESGIERSEWNRRGVQNMLDTSGFGVGIGSARTSSLITVLLSNVGIPGMLLYLWFLRSSFLRSWPLSAMPPPEDRDGVLKRRIFSAGRAGALALVLAHIIAGGNVDGGVQFFVFAAVASGAYAPRKRPRKSMEIQPVGGGAPRLFYSPQPIGEFGSASAQNASWKRADAGSST